MDLPNLPRAATRWIGRSRADHQRTGQGVNMTGQVQGKVALVTGGASGIGAAVAELLARRLVRRKAP
jgi:NADPH:quinone reductase-like Zn-dependent oxidoreductase